MLQHSEYFQICDLPLAIMDARSFSPDDQVLNYLHFNFLFMIFHNLNGGIIHNPLQKWYYYSHQKTNEVLVFHQYSKVRVDEVTCKVISLYHCFRASSMPILTQPFKIRIVLKRLNQECLLNLELLYIFKPFLQLNTYVALIVISNDFVTSSWNVFFYQTVAL